MTLPVKFQDDNLPATQETTDPLKAATASVLQSALEDEMQLWSNDEKVIEKREKEREKYPRLFAERERSKNRILSRLMPITVRHQTDEKPRKKARPEDYEEKTPEELRTIIAEGETIDE